MTPLFKRFLKRTAAAAAVMLLIAILDLLGRTSGLSSEIRSLETIVNTNNITADSFSSAAKAKRTEEMLQSVWDSSHNHNYGYTAASNEFDVVVPDILGELVNIRSRTIDFSTGMGFALAAACAAYAFADERGRKKQSFVNALPYKRSRLFFDRVLSGVTAISVFFLMVYIILALFVRHYAPAAEFLGERLAMGAEYLSRTKYLRSVGMDMFMNALAALLFYSVMMLAQTMFGRAASACVMACGALIFGKFAVGGAGDVCTALNSPIAARLREGLARFAEMFGSEHLSQIVLILIFTLIFLAAAYFADKNTRLERAGEVFIFGLVKYAAIALFAAEGAFTFFHVIYRECGIRPQAVLPVIGILAAGAALTVLMFNKLILRGER